MSDFRLQNGQTMDQGAVVGTDPPISTGGIVWKAADPPLFLNDIIVKFGEVATFRFDGKAVSAVKGGPEGRVPEKTPEAAPRKADLGTAPFFDGLQDLVWTPGTKLPEQWAKWVPPMGLDEVQEHLTAIADLISTVPGAAVTTLLNRPAETLDAERAEAEQLSGYVLADPNAFYVLQVPESVPPKDVDLLVAQLAASPVVEYAYRAPVPFPPNVDIAPTTSLFPVQGYLAPAPGGIDAQYAWTFPGGKGRRDVRLIDVEGTWNLDHEDLPSRGELYFDGSGAGSWGIWDRNHGTAVLGIVAAQENRYGFTGIAPHCSIGVCTWIRLSNIAGAIDDAAARLQRGDILLIEVHLPGPASSLFGAIGGDQTGFVPVEFYPDIAEVIRRAIARGIVVVEAAGNGSVDLDMPPFSTRISDTGAIVVGAGNPPTGTTPRFAASFSNFGARVNLQGWGSGVSTLGYGGIRVNGDDPNQWYTMAFGGTSSASPIVAGAAAILQSVRREAGLPVLDSIEMRDALVRTGTPQPPADQRRIGPLPDLRRAIDELAIPPQIRPDWALLTDASQPAADAPVVVTDAENRINVFYVGEDAILYQIRQDRPSNGWGPAQIVRRQDEQGIRLAGRPGVVRYPDNGRLELFARGADGRGWRVFQDEDGGRWTRWGGWNEQGGVGELGGDPVMTFNNDTRIEAFVRWSDGSVRHTYHRFRAFGGGPWSGWDGLEGNITGRVSAVRNASGRLEVFARVPDGTVWSRAQITPGGGWAPWGQVGGGVLSTDPVAAFEPTSSRIVVAGRGTDGTPWFIRQTASDGGWNGTAGWQQVVPSVLAEGACPALAADANGRINIFARQPDGDIGHSVLDGSAWSPWTSLGGNARSDPAVGMNADTRLEVIARGSDGRLVHRWQPFV